MLRSLKGVPDVIWLYVQKTVNRWILIKTQFCAPTWTAAAWVSSFMHYSLKWLEKFYCFPSLHLFVFHSSLNLFIQMPHIPFPKSHKGCVVFSLIGILLLAHTYYSIIFTTKMQFNIFWKRNFYRRKGIFSKGDNHKWCHLFENWLEQWTGLG